MKIQYVPRPHQQIAGEFLRNNPRCALFLDMGLGKTVVTLTRLKELIYEEFSVYKALVIAPKRVAEDTWSRECAKWDHLKALRVVKVMGTPKQREKALAQDADIYVINFENVVWLIDYLGPNWPFNAVVIDELSGFKSPQAKRWRVLKRVIKLSDNVIGLTGTPAPNGYMDLWPQIYLLDGGARLGRTITEFRTTYFRPGAHKGHIVYEWKLCPGAKDRIDAKLSDLCLSMSKEDWIDLPPKLYNTVEVRLNREERLLYDQFQRDRVLPLLGGEVATLDSMDTAIAGPTAAAVSNKLLQMANGAVYDDRQNVFHLHDEKLAALAELTQTCAGQPLLVFYSYKHDLSRLKTWFPQAKELEGPEDITAWNEGRIPMLLAHPASAGHGLNLQDGGHIVIWFGLPWSLELYQQANDRLHRQGQQNPVIIHHIVCADTLDERVLAVLEDKDATQRGLLDALKGYIADGTTNS